MLSTGLRGAMAVAAVAMLALETPPLAGSSHAIPRTAIPPGLQTAALLCLGEALRLCPDAPRAKDHGIACLKDKRHQLSVPCRGVYDQGVSFLKGGDVHLDLRALQRKPPRAPLPKPDEAHPSKE